MLDAKDQELLAERIRRRDAIPGPRIGDFVKLQDGTLRRFTYNWGDRIQTTLPGVSHCSSSFYLDSTGLASFSGSLDDPIPISELHLIEGTVQDGHFWMFHHNVQRAHNGVDVVAPCRVFEHRPSKVCGCSGVIKGTAPLAKHVREKAGIQAPNPVGIEFDACEQHTVTEYNYPHPGLPCPSLSPKSHS